MTKTVTITYKAFSTPFEQSDNCAKLSFSVAYSGDDYALLEALFHDTNTYSGSLWNIIKDLLPAERTHTALSVGDEVEIDRRVYRCERIGWQELTTASALVEKFGTHNDTPEVEPWEIDNPHGF